MLFLFVTAEIEVSLSFSYGFWGGTFLISEFHVQSYTWIQFLTIFILCLPWINKPIPQV